MKREYRQVVLTDMDKIRYDKKRYPGKQVKVLYEPVAVRRSHTAGLTESHISGKAIGVIFVMKAKDSEKACRRSAKPEYPDSKIPGKDTAGAGEWENKNQRR